MACDYDLLIVGGGLAGNCLALALKETGMHIAVVEASSREQLQNHLAGDRALALAAGTVQRLQELGVWQDIQHQATAIKTIHVSDRGHFGKTRLSAQKENVEALGYVITARNIETHVAHLVESSAIECISPARVAGLMAGLDEMHVSLKHNDESLTLSCKLLVGADGGNSSVRKLLDIDQHVTAYDQTALISTVRSSLPNHHTAYERFTPSGPLALLPIGDYHSAVIWTQSPENAQALMTGNEADFLAELQLCFGFKLGELSLASSRHAFPLSLIRAKSMIADRAVIIGNAAHQLHPVAGQGFNLGIRDVIQLADKLNAQYAQHKDIGAGDFLQAYANARQRDHDRTIAFTDNLIRIFSNDWLAIAAARNVSLTLLDHIPFAKSLLTRHAMGIAENFDSKN
ncbi:2-octaprenyl-6-methoxyphenyl hydroxylase [Crenothrix sp.]|uniref:2-octaprenyl-6-methoxyphenyl hydroxylase n=1 Tax=Crenothrix sp. TaxID=3100433 RepID=UPI00374DEE0C